MKSKLMCKSKVHKYTMIVRTEGGKGTEFTKTNVRIEAARFARASHLTLVFANSVPFPPSERTSTLHSYQR